MELTDGRRRPPKRASLLALALLALGLVGGVLLTEHDRSPAGPHDATPARSVRFAPTAWALQIEDVAAMVRRRQCSPQYDYPGCTSEQQWSMEASTKAEFRSNYDKGRWSQGPRVQNQFDDLTDERRDKLRRLYNKAVDDYVARQKAKGVVGKAAQPRYATFHDFVVAMECGGNFGVFSGLVNAACVVSKPINWLADNTTDLFLACDGWTVGGAFVGGAAAAKSAKWAWTAIKVGTMEGAATTAAGCSASYLYENLMPW